MSSTPLDPVAGERLSHAEEVLLADAVGPHLARSLAQLVARYGPAVIPNIDAAVDALSAGAG